MTIAGAKLGEASGLIATYDECEPGTTKRRPGVLKAFCMECGMDLENRHSD